MDHTIGIGNPSHNCVSLFVLVRKVLQRTDTDQIESTTTITNTKQKFMKKDLLQNWKRKKKRFLKRFFTNHMVSNILSFSRHFFHFFFILNNFFFLKKNTISNRNDFVKLSRLAHKINGKKFIRKYIIII